MMDLNVECWVCNGWCELFKLVPKQAIYWQYIAVPNIYCNITIFQHIVASLVLSTNIFVAP